MEPSGVTKAQPGVMATRPATAAVAALAALSILVSFAPAAGQGLRLVRPVVARWDTSRSHFALSRFDLAGMLYDSIRGKLLVLPDETLVLPDDLLQLAGSASDDGLPADALPIRGATGQAG